jgi:rare lipoprotein A
MKLATLRAALTAGLWTTVAWLAGPGGATAKALQPVKALKAPYQVGRAAWYGLAFQGHRTASGERFDMNGFTAAHRRLPLGSLVRVTNLANFRSVVVRINDRGPWKGGRIIDLSYAASKALGLASSGVGEVRLDPVSESLVLASY